MDMFAFCESISKCISNWNYVYFIEFPSFSANNFTNP